MGTYAKAIAALLGNVVGIIIVFAASKGLGTCTTAGIAETCTIFGFSTAQITAAVLSVVNIAFVYFSPPNTPTA